MKILFDPEIFFHGRCGMVRYYSKLISELQEQHVEIDLPLLVSTSDFIHGSRQYLQHVRKLPLVGRRLRLHLDIQSKERYWHKVRQGDYDLVFISSPVFEDNFLSYLPTGKKFIMVVHDTMRCILGPDGLFDGSGNNADKLAYLIRRAAKVISISHKVEEDIHALTKVEPAKVSVIYTGNLFTALSGSSPNLISLPSKYLLFVGDRTGRKNFRFAVRAISPLLREQQDLFLVCTGAGTVWEHDLFESLGIAHKVLFKNAPDTVLEHLYQHAAALLYPSLYEGFGLPVLEAMSLGCPVLTSDFGALKEIGGDAVIYADTKDSDSILSSARKLLDTNFDRALFIKRGKRQAQKFTVEKMAASFVEEMEKALRL